uniref:Aldehyde dehydrogenase domain-containing protein n=1 Tax=Ditylenchus dipsaci TaxID=166011 RepID=A0A915D3I8_9BILA
MVFEVIKDLSKGLYFFQGKRQTVDSQHYFPVYEPRIGEVVAKCPIADSATLQQIVEQASEAQPGWASLSAQERSKVLFKAADIIRENLEAIAVWEVKTNGKSIKEARCDIASSADTFTFYAGVLPAAFKGDYFDLPTNGENDRFAYTKREPFVWLDVLVHGITPSKRLLGKLPLLWLQETVLSTNQAHLHQLGEGETGTDLCLNEIVRKVSFTGSVATGCKVQQACAQRGIKPVTLELGGKSAFVVFEDADISNAVSAAILANFLSQGEVCTNATRVFVQEKIVDEFTKKLLIELDKIKVGDPLKEETNIGATINEQQLNKVIGLVERAKSQGANVLRGGKKIQPEGVENGFYFEPAVINKLSDDWEIVKEEIFGAVLLILPFESELEVIQRANKTSFGLASGIYTKSLNRAHRVAAKLECGTIYINTYNDTEVHVPFGGFKILDMDAKTASSAFMPFHKSRPFTLTFRKRI